MKASIQKILNNFLAQVLFVVIAFEVGYLFASGSWNFPAKKDTSIVPTVSPIPVIETISPTSPMPTDEISPSIEPIATSSATPTISITPEVPTPSQSLTQ